MAFKFFTIQILNGEPSEAELNGFLRSHKVLNVERHWVDQGANSYWSFCIDYLDRTASASSGSRPPGQRAKVDYREVLSADDFALFAKLRELRKAIAQTDGVPVYTIFNNDQLAQMVQKKARSKSDLESITGVGDARTEKYGARFLEALTQQRDTIRETDSKPV